MLGLAVRAHLVQFDPFKISFRLSFLKLPSSLRYQ